MFRHAIRPGLMLAACWLALSACGPASKAAPTLDANAVYTQAAGTVQAALTQASALTPSPTATTEPTQTAQPTAADTATQPAVTPTSEASATPAATATLAPSPQRVEFVGQTPADGSTLNPGTHFIVTWKIKNTGTITWSTKYMVRYFSGDQMGGPASSFFPKEVKPNDTVDLALPLVSPSSAGKYQGNWVLSTADGANFYPISIQINVANLPTATNTAPAPTATVGTPAETATVGGPTETPSVTPTP